MNKWIVAVLLFVPLSARAVDCPKGQSVWQDGCVVDIQPEKAPSVKPSDENPPSDKMPSYQREGVHVIDVPNMAGADIKADQDKRDADEQGKKAAGLK